MVQSTRWCFTDNNPLVSLRFHKMRYLVYGREVGSSGNLHHQGFVIFSHALRLSACKKLLPRAHWEVTRGTSQQAAVYCKKDGDFQEFGDVPTPGGKVLQSERWDNSMVSAKRGAFDDIPNDLRIRYYTTFKRIRSDYMPKLSDIDNVCGHWIWGKTGIGKSTRARELYPDPYEKEPNKWWCGYENERYVVIDDLDPTHHWMARNLKLWGDKYPFRAELKGSNLRIRPEVICVTSQYHPRDIFKNDEDLEAIRRRFKIEEYIRV